MQFSVCSSAILMAICILTPREITAQTTNHSQRHTTFAAELPECRDTAADIFFLIDISEAAKIHYADFKVENLIKAFVASFNMSENLARFGAAYFGDEVVSVIAFSDRISRDQLLYNRPPNVTLPPREGLPNTISALLYAIFEAFSPNEARAHVPHILFVLTDGNTEYPSEWLQKVAQWVQDDGITIYAVSYSTDTANGAGLSAIASAPDSQYVINIDDLPALASRICLAEENNGQ